MATAWPNGKVTGLRARGGFTVDIEWKDGKVTNYRITSPTPRLGDGAQAYQNLLNLVKEDSDANLMTFSRSGVAGAAENIFVIDGNMAGAAGIAEMLLQSYSGEIELLPALPSAWPSGKVTGLRARGGFMVDMTWKDHELTSATLLGRSDASCRVRYGGKTITGTLKPGNTLRIDRKAFFP
jgi:alpha-L-fucosidase 2